ncbi:hypothetical protein AMTR_s00099p00113400 [Amborella trichopoda]|uniref:Uncharacterized protein n=1 Tax=Amborella trichopoda TaxID=13333 RepID=W1NVW6_AMBTC|nr:hypothetical protein AMTR_s00099p00113400 [Amborella trichopoda]
MQRKWCKKFFEIVKDFGANQQSFRAMALPSLLWWVRYHGLVWGDAASFNPRQDKRGQIELCFIGSLMSVWRRSCRREAHWLY